MKIKPKDIITWAAIGIGGYVAIVVAKSLLDGASEGAPLGWPLIKPQSGEWSQQGVGSAVPDETEGDAYQGRISVG